MARLLLRQRLRQRQRLRNAKGKAVPTAGYRQRQQYKFWILDFGSKPALPTPNPQLTLDNAHK
jgi:hypothetical protein